MTIPVRQGALRVDKYSSRKGGFHLCEDCSHSGRFRLSICGWPLGNFCSACVKRMSAAWDSCFEAEEKLAA